jgi:hypothetical protein
VCVCVCVCVCACCPQADAGGSPRPPVKLRTDQGIAGLVALSGTSVLEDDAYMVRGKRGGEGTRHGHVP